MLKEKKKVKNLKLLKKNFYYGGSIIFLKCIYNKTTILDIMLVVV